MSYPFKKILCPVQLDDSEQIALDLASHLAKDMDATLYLLHVVPIMPIDAPNVAAGAKLKTDPPRRGVAYSR